MNYYVKNDLSLILDARYQEEGDRIVYRRAGKVQGDYPLADFTKLDVTDEKATYGLNKYLFKLVDGVPKVHTITYLKAREAEKKKENDRKELKEKLYEDMAQTTVELNGKVFWADPGSEQNFSGRIRQMELEGLSVTKWAQGFEVFDVTIDELKTVVAEGTKKNAALWDKYIEDISAL
jgi:hypothetical protein